MQFFSHDFHLYIYHSVEGIPENTTIKDGRDIKLKGSDFIVPHRPLNCGNSGTTVRLMTGLLAGQKLKAKFIGDQSLSKRPMDRIVNPLIDMGINISCDNGTPPITRTTNVMTIKLRSLIMF